MDEHEKQYLRARKRVKELKGFYTHFTVYLLVIGFLAVINIVTGADFPWVFFPAGGWGIGLGIHAFQTFFYGVDWEERKIEELIAQQRGEKPKRQKQQEDYFTSERLVSDDYRITDDGELERHEGAFKQ